MKLSDFPGELADEHTFGFPELQYKNKSGQIQTWRIIVRVKNPDDTWADLSDDLLNQKLSADIVGWVKVINKTHLDTIKKTSPDIISRGKNIGKKNETNVFVQAMMEAESKYTKQKRKTTAGKSKDKAHTELYPPMLAKKLSDVSITFDDVIHVQRKYNGVRIVSTMVDDNVIMYSRNRLEYHGFDYIKSELKPIFTKFANDYPDKQLFLDGELYKHGVPLQTISGIARKIINNSKKQTEELLQYYIYDCFIVSDDKVTDDKFDARLKILNDYLNESEVYVKVPTEIVSTVDDIQKYYKQYLGEKYEGIMVRTNGIYEPSYNNTRSNSLLKIKPKLDDEFTIVDYASATKGKASGAVIFVLETAAGKQFNIMPSMESSKLKKLYLKMSTVEDNGKTHFENKYKGKKMTIYFDELSKDGVPVRLSTQDSVGVSNITVDGEIVRDYE